VFPCVCSCAHVYAFEKEEEIGSDTEMEIWAFG
jgi:hypothetical protein